MWLLITAIDISTPDRRFILDADTNRTLDRCKCFLPGSQYAFPICRFSLTQAWLNSKRDGGRSLLDKNYVRLSAILKPKTSCAPGGRREAGTTWQRRRSGWGEPAETRWWSTSCIPTGPRYGKGGM